MTSVTIDSATAAALVSLEGNQVEICDESGKLLGWYAPVRPTPTHQELLDSCPTPEEELERRFREEKNSGRAWSEIKKI